jgi:DNA-3-methyladenine glycosylase II
LIKCITLDEKSDEIIYLCHKDKRLNKVIQKLGSLQYPVYDDSYSFIVHEIIEQMLSVKASQKIYHRLENLCDMDVSVETISSLSDSEIKSIGTAKRKVSCIRRFTEKVKSGEINFNKISACSDQEIIDCLTEVKGIGEWTAKMYLIFCLNRKNVLPYEDAAFLQSYKWLYKTNDCTPASVKARCKKWEPFCSIAARYLYRALDTGLVNHEFHLYKSWED